MKKTCFYIILVLAITGCVHKMHLDNLTIYKSIKIGKKEKYTHLCVFEGTMTGKKNLINILYPLSLTKSKYTLNDLELVIYLGKDRKRPAQIDLNSSMFEIVFVDGITSDHTKEGSVNAKSNQYLSLIFDLRFINGKQLKGKATNLSVKDLQESNEIPEIWEFKEK